MIERDGFDGPITFCCDECGELDDTRCTDFASALSKTKSHGWKARKVGDDWQHLCSDCGSMTRHSPDSLATERRIEAACLAVNPNVDERTLAYTKAVARELLKEMRERRCLVCKRQRVGPTRQVCDECKHAIDTGERK